MDVIYYAPQCVHNNIPPGPSYVRLTDLTVMILLVPVHALLLLAFSRVAVSQCEYVYVSEPPRGQLICDPYPINQLQLVCSIFVTGLSLPDMLRIQWFLGVPDSGQFNPANVTLLQEVEFDVALLTETYTSRIVVNQIRNYMHVNCNVAS